MPTRKPLFQPCKGTETWTWTRADRARSTADTQGSILIVLSLTCHTVCRDRSNSALQWPCGEFTSFNPFTAPAWKMSALKSVHIHACRQYIWWSYNKSSFDTVHFDRNHFTCSCKGEKKALMISDLALLLVAFRVTARQAWQWKG